MWQCNVVFINTIIVCDQNCICEIKVVLRSFQTSLGVLLVRQCWASFKSYIILLVCVHLSCSAAVIHHPPSSSCLCPSSSVWHHSSLLSSNKRLSFLTWQLLKGCPWFGPGPLWITAWKCLTHNVWRLLHCCEGTPSGSATLLLLWFKAQMLGRTRCWTQIKQCLMFGFLGNGQLGFSLSCRWGTTGERHPSELWKICSNPLNSGWMDLKLTAIFGSFSFS